MDKAIVVSILQVLMLGTGIAAYFLKDAAKRKMAVIAFITACTALVGYTFYQPLAGKGRDSKPLAIMDSSQAEFVMRLSAALDDFMRESGMGAGDSKSKEMTAEMQVNALKMAGVAVEHDPKSVSMHFRRLLIAGEAANAEAKRDGLKALREVLALNVKIRAEAASKALDDTRAKPPVDAANKIAAEASAATAIPTEPLYPADSLIEAMYNSHSFPAAELPKGLAEINALTSRGWFRDVATIELYRAAHDKSKADQLLVEYHERLQAYLLRIFCLAIAAVMLGGIGSIVFIGQFFFWPRRLTSEAERPLIAAPRFYGLLTMYGVFIGWLALECVCAPLLANMAGLIKKPGGPMDPLTVGLTILIFYTLNNMPSILIAWLVAIRPTGVKFIDAIKLRVKGPSQALKLIGTGILAWLCAIPLITVSAVITKSMHAEGSSNPILPVISEVVRSDSWFIIFLFIFVLGAVPAICEETFFRGFLYSGLRAKYNVFISVLISAGIFAAVHMDPNAFLQLFILGAIFALVMERTRSLLPSMVAHCLWNSGTLVLMMTAFGG